MTKTLLQIAQQKALRGNDEHTDQALFMQWMFRLPASKYPGADTVYAIPNAGKRGRAAAGRMVAEGLRAGYPDLCVPRPENDWGALYLELKAAWKWEDAARGVNVKETRPTETQARALFALRDNHNACAVCYGLEALQWAVQAYYLGTIMLDTIPIVAPPGKNDLAPLTLKDWYPWLSR